MPHVWYWIEVPKLFIAIVTLALVIRGQLRKQPVVIATATHEVIGSIGYLGDTHQPPIRCGGCNLVVARYNADGKCPNCTGTNR